MTETEKARELLVKNGLVADIEYYFNNRPAVAVFSEKKTAIFIGRDSIEKCGEWKLIAAPLDQIVSIVAAL